MLDELKNLNYYGGKDGLLFFLCDVIGTSQRKISDAAVLCSYSPGKCYLALESLIRYCEAFGWIELSDKIISVSPSIAKLLNDKAKLNDALIESTVNQLFRENLLDSEMFCYDLIQFSYSFKNEMLPLSLSVVRNTLISQGFFVPLRNAQGTRFYISSSYDSLIARYCKEQRKQLSLDKLKRQLHLNELAGEKAELFVLEYEKKRLGMPLSEKVRRISEIDVEAGYDIVSFASLQSQEPDRFIEVKAVSDAGFYWSKKEYEIARLKGDKYYLYLVELNRINQEDYSPLIIPDPAVKVMEADNWFVEAQSFLIRPV